MERFNSILLEASRNVQVLCYETVSVMSDETCFRAKTLVNRKIQRRRLVWAELGGVEEATKVGWVELTRAGRMDAGSSSRPPIEEARPPIRTDPKSSKNTRRTSSDPKPTLLALEKGPDS